MDSDTCGPSCRGMREGESLGFEQHGGNRLNSRPHICSRELHGGARLKPPDVGIDFLGAAGHTYCEINGFGKVVATVQKGFVNAAAVASVREITSEQASDGVAQESLADGR